MKRFITSLLLLGGLIMSAQAAGPLVITQLTSSRATSLPITPAGVVGTIGITAAGGSGMYQFSIDSTADADFVPVPASTTPSQVFNNVTVGLHVVRVRDGADPAVVIAANMEVAEPDPVQITAVDLVNPTDATATGSITVTVDGGVAPYTYVLNGSTTLVSDAPSITFPNLFANPNPGAQYTITVNSSEGSSAQAIVALIINTGNPLIVTKVAATRSNTLPANSGTITLTAAGGSGTYQFNIDGGAFAPVPASADPSFTFPNVSVDSHIVIVRDGANTGTTVTSTIDVEESDPVEIAVITINNPTCSNVANGSIIVQASGAFGPYNFSDGFTSSGPQDSTQFTFPNLTGAAVPGKSYGISVSAIQEGSVAEADVPLVSTTPVAVIIDNFTSPTCNGGTDATIQATVSGGTPPYQVSVVPAGTQPVTGSNPYLFQGLSANTEYVVHATDANGCTGTSAIVLIAEPQALLTLLPPTIVNPDCVNLTLGSITINVSADPSIDPTTIRYSLNGGTTQVSPTFTNLPAGTYTLKAEVEGSPTVICATGTATLTAMRLRSTNAITNFITDVLCKGGCVFPPVTA